MKKVLALLLAMTMLLGVTACTTKAASEEEATETTTEATAEAAETATEENGPKKLTIALSWLPGNLDPAIGWNGWALCRSGVGENLVQIDENGSLKNVIAESYERIDDQTMKFTIREGVVFHNGKAVDAEAVKKSLERTLAMEEREDVKFPMEEIIADGMTLTIKTSEPFATLLNNLADPYYIIIDTDYATEEIQVQPVATGAFKVVKFTPDEGIELVKHDQHWSGPIGVDEVHSVYIKDATTRAMALQSGDVDIAQRLNTKDLALFENDPNFTVDAGPNLRVVFIRPNMKKPIMQELKFRQALHYGMDTKTYAEKITNTQVANGPFNSSLPFGATGEMPYAYDKEKAISLLDELGMVDTDNDGIREFEGQNIKLTYLAKSAGEGDTQNVATAIQAQLQEIGIGIELMLVENTTDLRAAGAFDLYLDGWTAAPTGDPEYFLRASYLTDGYGNVAFYSDEKMDAYVEELAATMNVEDRYELGREATAYAVDDVASIFIYYKNGSLVKKSNIHGVERFISEIYMLDERVTMD